MLNEQVKLFGMSDLVRYLKPKLPSINVQDVLSKYVSYDRIERFYLEGGGDDSRLAIVEIIKSDFSCEDIDYILIDSGW